MSRIHIFSILIVLAITLAACASSGSPTPIIPTPVTPLPATPTTESAVPNSNQGLVRTDSQGSVEFAVMPLNLAAPADTLDFDVSMNTHSVDLAWDLAAQSTLTTDAGVEVKGLSWSAGSGHHYENTLTFPAQTAEGQSVLAGATQLTLTIRDTDVTERVFVWVLAD